VLPVCVPVPIAPHDTTQSAPMQFVTLHPAAGQVTWHSGLPAQSTEQCVVPLHSTWQIWPLVQPTSQEAPGLHCTSHGPAPATQSAEQLSFAAQTQLLPLQISLPPQPTVASAINKTRLFMVFSDGRVPVYARSVDNADITQASGVRDRDDIQGHRRRPEAP
jgi:hypothetical protein